jgi:von Willebrand factor type A domain
LITATTTLEFGAQESTKESNIYGMVTLKAPSLLSSTATEKELDELHVPVDIVCVVDQSGSMQGSKISLLKDTLNYIVDQMGILDRLAIISFNTSAYDQSNGLKLMTTEK